jgi:hypothetical protein
LFIGEIKHNGIRDDMYDGLIWSEAKGAWSSTKLEIGTRLHWYPGDISQQYKHFPENIIIAISNGQNIPYFITWLFT